MKRWLRHVPACFATLVLFALPASASETITYTYDALGRLVAVESSGDVNDDKAAATNYDAAGNRTNFTVTGVGGGGAQALLSIGNAAITEGGTLTFIVTRSGNTSTAASASYATSNGTAVAPGDYTAKSNTVSFAANETSKSVTVTSIDDGAAEPAETMTVTLSSPSSGATITNALGTGTINDNDTGPPFSIADASGAEGATLNFTVSVAAHSGSISVVATTSNGTAVAPADYTSKSQTLTFAPSETSKFFSVVTLADALSESSETLTVTLSGPSGGTIGDGTATGTITNVAPAQLAIGNAGIGEGGTLTFTVTRSATTSSAVSASYATANGTATAPGDYTSKTGTVSFAANEVSKNITVATVNDATVEAAETLSVTLSNAAGAVITTATGTGTITDNDSTALVAITSNLTVLPAHQSQYQCGGTYYPPSPYYPGVPGYFVGGCAVLPSQAQVLGITALDGSAPVVNYLATGYSWSGSALSVQGNYYGTP